MNFHIIPSTNILIIKDNQILLSRRINTGWMDDKLCLPGGHIEEGETPRQAAVRELSEELGINLPVDDLEFLCVVARNTQPNSYVAYEFALRDKGIKYINAEPDKCSELVWADINNLPNDLIPFIADIIQNCIIGDRKYLELDH